MAKRTIQPFRTNLSWEWTAATGALLVVLGIVVIGISTFATLVISWMLGLILLVSGAAQLWHALRITFIHGSAIRFLLAAISVIAGVVVLKAPATGAIGITLVVAFYLLFAAAAKGVLVLEDNKEQSKAWLILSSVVSGFLGIYLLITLPISSLIIPGTLLGVDLLFYGCFELSLSAKIRRKNSSLDVVEFRQSA